MLLILRLRVWIVQMIYGKYSYAYISFFKKRDLKPDVLPCLKDHYLTHFYPFYRKAKDSVLFKSRQPIQYGEFRFGSSYRESPKGSLDADNFSVYKVDSDILSAYGFRGQSFGAKHKEVAFFLNNQFLLGEYSFSMSDKNSMPDTDRIVSELARRYQVDLGGLKSNFYIEDGNDSLIYVLDTGFSFNLSYFSPTVAAISDKMEKWFEEPRLKDEEPLSDDSLSL